MKLLQCFQLLFAFSLLGATVTDNSPNDLTWAFLTRVAVTPWVGS